MSDRKVKVREIADILKISAGSVHTIIHEHLGMKKVFSKWVPRLLTPEQKQINENDGKIERIGLRIASPSTVFSRFGPQRLLALRRP